MCDIIKCHMIVNCDYIIFQGFVELENGTRVIDNITVVQYRGE